MKNYLNLIPLFLYLGFVSCGHDHDHHHGHEHGDKEHGSGGHAHHAPHGGTLVLLGDHGTGFHLELLLDENGTLEAYVLDGEAENFVRISQEEFEIETKGEEGAEKTISLEAVADPATEETVGDTSFFRANEQVEEITSFEGNLKSLSIKGKKFENISFRFPEGNE